MASATPMPNRFGLPLPKFSGKQSDWESFEANFKAYMKVSNARYSQLFDQIESQLSEITDTTFLESDGSVVADALELSHQLGWVLLNVCEGTSEAVLRAASTKHGFEQWRLLRLRYAGSSGIMALELISYKFGVNDFESDLTNYEEKYLRL